jgi:hypothetical protein
VRWRRALGGVLASCLFACGADTTLIGYQSVPPGPNGAPRPSFDINTSAQESGGTQVTAGSTGVDVMPSQGPDCSGSITQRIPSDVRSWINEGANPSEYAFSTGRIQSTARTHASSSATVDTAVFDLAPFLGARVRLSAIIWGSNIRGAAGLYMGVGDADNRYLAFDDMSSRALTGTVSENRYQIELDVDQNAHWIAFGLWLSGLGDVTVTDPIFEIIVPTRRDYMPDPAGWFAAGSAPSDYSIQLDSNVERCGRSTGVVAQISPSSGFGTIMQELSADDYRGGRVRMTAFVRTQDVAQIAALWLRGDDRNGQTHAFDNMYDRPILGTNGWASFEIVLDVPSEVESLFYGMYVQGAGSAWIDGTRFERVDDDVPVTR